MSRAYKTEAVILSRRNYSETDRIITLFTKHLGKIAVIAKGVRKPSSRKRGSLEVFSHIRFSAAKGKNLDIMTEVETINNFDLIREDLTRVSVAYFFVETIQKATADAEENSSLFDFLLENIDQLSSRADIKALREQYVTDLLIRLGYWPQDKELEDHDKVLESVLEKSVSSRRVGKIVLT